MNDIAVNVGKHSGLSDGEQIVLKACKPATASWGIYYDIITLQMRLAGYIRRGEYNLLDLRKDLNSLVRQGYLAATKQWRFTQCGVVVVALTPAGSDMLRDKVA